MLRPSEKSLQLRVLKIISLLKKHSKDMIKPMVFSIVDQYGPDPFLVLISCILSLRAKDVATLPVCIDLFRQAKTPQEIVQLSSNELEKIIYPIGFYRKKAETIKRISRALLDEFEGKVPNTRQKLLLLPGVGRKTANLVLGLGFNIPAICVDTHVHRISNRLGLIVTKTPEETELALEKIIPKQYWIDWNRLLVMWGQNICVPISPFCSCCAVYDLCDRIGVCSSR